MSEGEYGSLPYHAPTLPPWLPMRKRLLPANGKHLQSSGQNDNSLLGGKDIENVTLRGVDGYEVF